MTVDYADLAPARPKGVKGAERRPRRSREVHLYLNPPIAWLIEQLREQAFTRRGQAPTLGGVIDQALVEMGRRENIRLEDWPDYEAYKQSLTRARGGSRLRRKEEE